MSLAQSFTPVTQHLRVSDDRRHLVFASGKPFFWLGDTGWELFHRLTYTEAKKYFSVRAQQGFTVIQAVVLAEFDGLHTPNANGHLPLENDDPLQPREPYFLFVDSVIDLAAQYGLYIAVLPTWGDKLFKDKWGTGPEIFNRENAKKYGAWIGNRYKNKKNIVWVVGGDRTPRNDSDVEIWRAMASGIVDGAGGHDRALITFHPQPSASSSSSPWFHEDEWLDFNMLQTGHCADEAVWNKVGNDYKKKTVKPVLNAEAVYEDHPVCFNAKDRGYTTAYDSRKAAWLSVLAGSLGYTYGCHNIWQFYAPGKTAVNGPLRFWYVSLDLPGAVQMKYLKHLMEALPMSERQPDQSMITNAYDSSRRVQALRGKDYVVVYSASGESFEVDLRKIGGKRFRALWLDPRTGARFPLPIIPANTKRTFTPPSKGMYNDWALVILDEDMKYLD
jgi:hypothetical protein